MGLPRPPFWPRVRCFYCRLLTCENAGTVATCNVRASGAWSFNFRQIVALSREPLLPSAVASNFWPAQLHLLAGFLLPAVRRDPLIPLVRRQCRIQTTLDRHVREQPHHPTGS